MVEHEIRTPVTVISGYARMLLDAREGPLRDSQKEFVLAIRRAAGRVEDLLDNLLELASGTDPTSVRIRRKPTSLRRLIRGAVEAIRPRAEERRMSVALDLCPEADHVYADPVRFEQVLTNLLSNAVKFAPEGSAVRVATGLEEGGDGGVIWIEIQDEGPGIAPDESERIFEPFVRGRAAAETSVQGVGLGLAICRKIVLAHGGSVEALPSRGGALFRVTVPLGA
jgi:signal transduction histidine kinase